MDEAAPMSKRPAAERFWPKVDVSAGPDGCWLWTAGQKGIGYGQFWTGERETGAHRWAYEALVGPIPEGLQLDHLCLNKLCVNPRHLEPVTQRENILRGTAPSAIAARRTHCVNGHPFTEDNIYRVKGYNKRFCRRCTIDRAVRSQRVRRQKAKERKAREALHSSMD